MAENKALQDAEAGEENPFAAIEEQLRGDDELLEALVRKKHTHTRQTTDVIFRVKVLQIWRGVCH